jgi:hypothetical protein
MKRQLRKPITEKEFFDKIKEINPNFFIIGKFNRLSDSIDTICKICGKKQRKRCSTLYYKETDCIKRHKGFKWLLKYSHKEYCDKVKKVNPQFTILEEYKECNQKIKIQCGICGKVYRRTACQLFKKTICSNCFYNQKKMTNQEFHKKLKKLPIYLDIEIINDYIDYNTKIKVKCKKCKTIYDVSPNNILRGSRCPSCWSVKTKGEQKVEQYLKNNDIFFLPQKTFKNCVSKKNRKLRFDFYIPLENVCIEYDGPYHFDKNFWLNKNNPNFKEHDEIKNKFCKDNNINLLRIPYWEEDNINNILFNYLKR